MSKDQLLRRIRKKNAKIAVIGIGYIGLPTAATLADLGFRVTGIDTNSRIVDEVSRGRSQCTEPHLEELVSRVHSKGTLTATVNTRPALGEADIIIICVQTPLRKNRTPNLSFVKSACKEIGDTLTKGKLIILQSTLPPKTTECLVKPLLERRSGLKCGTDFWLAYCPERMAPGTGLRDLHANGRLIGGYDPESSELAAELFGLITLGQVQITDLASAEVSKLAENAFRYVNIAFANELALICRMIGADISEVIRLANSHPRVNIHKPGCGVGGPCLSKDSCLLLGSVKQANFRHRVMRASLQMNNHMPKYFAKLVTNALKKVGKSIENSRIAVLGTAYKGDVDDTRGSPSKEIIRSLTKSGAELIVYDPYCNESFGAKKAKDITEAARGSDCIFVATEHKEFRKLDFAKLKGLMNENPIIVDGRLIIDFTEARKLGFICLTISGDAS
jgi:UDP-N-acetyl-D-mannosaminuronic acid dehydrogenase